MPFKRTLSEGEPMRQVNLIFEKQWLHALFLALLVIVLKPINAIDSFQKGNLLGLDSLTWFWLAVALAIIHQVFVWLCWRTQLHLSLLTNLWGDRGFTLYAFLFSMLGIARVVLVFILAISNQGTLSLAPFGLKILAVIALLPALYLFYSVYRYFGFKRAFGIDHFDASYRSVPFVRKGIFQFTSNGMYVFGFFLLWVPGLWYGSVAALCAALFNHLYIWVHYYGTELPDIKRIYE
jgi:hypothetical protein